VVNIDPPTAVEDNDVPFSGSPCLRRLSAEPVRDPPILIADLVGRFGALLDMPLNVERWRQGDDIGKWCLVDPPQARRQAVLPLVPPTMGPSVPSGTPRGSDAWVI
jgi:hypothetical protein